MRYIYAFIITLFIGNLGFGQIISQYVETDSGSDPKGIEIWNNTGETLNFATNNLVIEKGTNGASPSADYTISSGTLADGDVIVIGTSGMQGVTEGNGSVFFLKSFTFNGDDSLVVKYGGTITDMFGLAGSDPGSSWVGSGVSTANQNIELNEGITTGDTDGWTDPSSRFNTLSTNPSGDGPVGFGVAPVIPSGCTAPTTQASSYSTTSLGSDSATLNWTSGNGDEVLVLVKEGAAIDTNPTDGTSYTGDTAFGSGTELGTGNYAVYAGTTANSVSITGLSPGVTYHVAIFEYNTTDTCYLTPGLTGNFTTSCSTPTDISGLSSAIASEQVDLSWSNGSCYDDILVVAKASTAVTVSPSGDGTTYMDDATFGSGTDLGTGEYAVYKGTGTSVSVTGLTNGTTYHFEVFARKGTSWSAGVVINETPFLIEEAVAGDLLITEVSGDDSDGSGSNNNGYMEIFNRSSKYINLGNIEARYFNSNPGSSTQQVSLSGTLNPGSFIIVTQNGTAYTTEFSDTADGTGTNFFFNGGDDGCDVYHTSNGIIDQFNDNGTGQLAWNWNDDFTYKRNTTASGALESSWDADGTNNTPRSKTNLYFWTGATDTTWGTASNWDAGTIPGSTTSVILANESNSLSITTSISIANLTNESGSSVIVEKTGNLEISGNLTNNGSLTLDSDSDQFSSLIVDGDATGNIQYNRYVNEISTSNSANNGNDLIASPFSGQTFGAFATANDGVLSASGTLRAFAPFNTGSGNYENYDTSTDNATPITAGTGYRAATDSGETLAFSGTLNSGDITVSLSDGASSYWNLIGNVYPSYLDLGDFLATNDNTIIQDAFYGIYGYDANASDGSVFTIWDLNTDGDFLIAPGQGFFVAAPSGGGTSVTFTESMRRTGAADDFIVGSGQNNTGVTRAGINLNTESKSYVTNFYFRDINTLGLDPGYDTGAFDQASDGLFSNLVENDAGIALVNQSLPLESLSNVSIPLVVNATAGEQLNFSLDSNTSLPANIEVYLEDILTGTSTLLNTSDYIFTPTSNLSGPGRFYVVFSDNALGVNEDSLNNVNIYALERELFIKGQLTHNTNATLFDMQGRAVLKVSLDTESQINTIDISGLSNGIYIVQLSDIEYSKSKKVILK